MLISNKSNGNIPGIVLHIPVLGSMSVRDLKINVITINTKLITKIAIIVQMSGNDGGSNYRA